MKSGWNKERPLWLRLLQGMLATAILCFGIPAGADDTAPSGPVHTLEQIVVTGTKTPHALKDTPVETVLVTRDDINKTNAQNIMDVLKNIQGISASVHDDTFGTYTWNAKMRGLNFNDGYALILIDGQRVMGPGQSGGMGEYGIGLNQIPVEMIERIEVVKGPGSALYGSDAMAGVINIITRKTPKKQTGGAGGAYGWYSVKERTVNGVVQQPLQKNRNQSQAYTWFGDRPYEKLGYLLQYNYEGAEDSGQTKIDSSRHSFMAKVDAEPADRTSLFSKIELSDFEEYNSQKEKSYRLSAGGEFRPCDDHFISLKGYTYNWDFTHGYVDRTYGYKYGDIAFHQIEGQHTWYLNPANALTYGAEFQRQGIDFVIINPDDSKVAVDREVDVFSLFFQDEIKFLDGKINLVPGIRYDDHSTFGNEFSPKLSAMYQIFDATTLRFSVGEAFKSPTIRQLYYDAPYKHGNYYNVSNPDLKPETALAYSAGVEQWLMNHRLMFSAGYFRNEVEDMVIAEETGTFYNGLPLQIYRNVNEAKIQGLEILSKAMVFENCSLSLSYTYTDSENKENGKNLTYTPEHHFSLTPAYDWVRYGAGISATLSRYSKQYTNTANTSQLDEHTVVDAKIYKQLGKAAKLSFEADNIFDSDKGDVNNYRVGQAFQVKLDITF